MRHCDTNVLLNGEERQSFETIVIPSEGVNHNGEIPRENMKHNSYVKHQVGGKYQESFSTIV